MTTYTFTGSGDFSQASNWNPSGGPPGAGDIAIIDSGTVTGDGSIQELDINGDATLNNLLLVCSGTASGNPANGNFGLDVNSNVQMVGGDINCTGIAVVIVGDTQRGSGNGSLTVTQGGQIECAAFTLGFEAGTSGSATFNGTAVSLTTNLEGGSYGFVNIGYEGSGNLVIENGATFTAANVGAIGFVAGSNGTVTVTNGGALSFGTISTSGVQLVVGGYGKGTLTDQTGAQNGAQTVVYGDAQIGYGTGVTGSIIIQGDGSLLNVSGTTTVGVSGTGTLNIFGGATAQLVDVVVAQNSSSGNNPNPSALEVSDTGSDLTAASLIVGQDGYGTFDIQNGATTEITGDVTAGENNGSVGTIYLEGFTTTPGPGSTPNLNVGGTLAVGVDGTGNLYVQGDGKLQAATLAIGWDGNSLGTGTGTLYIDSGGYVQVTGDMTVEGTTGSGGSVSDSSGTITVGGDLDLGDQAGSIVTMTVQEQSLQGNSVLSDVQVTGDLNLGEKTNLYISQGGSLEWGGTVTIVGGAIDIAHGGSMQPMMNTGGEFIDQHGDVTVEANSLLTTGDMTVDPTAGSVSGSSGFQTLGHLEK